MRARELRPVRRGARIVAGVGLSLLGAAGAAAQIAWLGPEIQVNTATAGSQLAPAITSDPTGGFVVAWQSADVDGSGFGIRVRRFEADGTPATPEIAVNLVTAGDQVSPAVALVGGLDFVVAWASNGSDGSGFGIVARRFAADGSPRSGEIAVNQTTAGSQVSPRVAPHDSGGFLAIWTGPGAGDSSEIFARGFDASGTALSGEFRVNATVSGQQISPALAATSGDSYAAAWASEGQDGSGYAVVARRFTATGGFLTGEIAVPQNTTLDQTSPAVVATAASFVVAWQRALQATPFPVGPQPIVAFRRFALDGAPLTGEIPLHLDTSVRHERPQATVDGDSHLIIAWEEIDPLSGRADAVASRWTLAGAQFGGELPLNTTLANDQGKPVVAAPGAGERFVAAWTSFAQDGSSFGIFAQRFGTPPAPCVEDAETLCLNDGRFRVRATFATAAGASGDAQAVQLTDDSGYLTFFDPANVELVVKVLDACGLPGFENFWVFATGLTNVEVVITVEDTDSSVLRTYRNDLNQAFEPILDTNHFQVCDSAGGGSSSSTSSRGAADSAPAAGAGSGGCVADADSLCLRDGRFEVTIDWTTAQGGTGQGQAFALTDESGYFWFFSPDNVELVIKVIDGCGNNDRFWIFAGGLTDVGTVLRVRDTAYPEAPVFERTKPIGTPFAPILTIDGFDTCP